MKPGGYILSVFYIENGKALEELPMDSDRGRYFLGYVRLGEVLSVNQLRARNDPPEDPVDGGDTLFRYSVGTTEFSKPQLSALAGMPTGAPSSFPPGTEYVRLYNNPNEPQNMYWFFMPVNEASLGLFEGGARLWFDLGNNPQELIRVLDRQIV